MKNIISKESELHIAKQTLDTSIKYYGHKLRLINNMDLFKIDPSMFTMLYTAHVDVLRAKINVYELERELEELKEGEQDEK